MEQLGEAGTGDTPSWPIRIRVEHGKCLEMARALRASAAAYLSDTPLRAVPTFPVVMNHWGTVGSDILKSLGCEMSRVLHGTEEFEYPNGPLAENTELEGAMRLVARERKTSRSNRGMTVMSFVADLHRPGSDETAVRIRRSIIELDAG